MKSFVKVLSFAVFPFLALGCGGGGGGSGGGGSASVPVNSASAVSGVSTVSLAAGVLVENTDSIVAERSFSFDVGQTITLTLDYSGSSEGALHLYSQAADTLPDGEVVADPTSRITTIYPHLTDEVELEVNGNWEQIYAHWVPMSSSEQEKSWIITLNQPGNSYHLSF